MDTLEKAVITEIVARKLNGESDLFYTMTCQDKQYNDDGTVAWECGQRFKFIRGTGGKVFCPKCERQQDSSQPGIREAIMAIPVND